MSRQDQVSINIKEKLRKLPSISSPAKSIFKVHNQLRMVNKEAYEPAFVAIGPYHRQDSRLHHMEDKKLHCLERRGEANVDRYVKALRVIEVETREHYAETDAFSPDEFIEIMLLDGCFILEYIRTLDAPQLKNHPVFSDDWISGCITRDLLLLENQLPFRVLTKLYTLMTDNAPSNLINLVLENLSPLHANPGLSEEVDRYPHLLDIVYQGMIFNASPGASIKYNPEDFFIPSATELEESGIKFKLRENVWLLDIKFANGTLEIPSVPIEDDTDSIFRNLVAYEQQSQSGKIKYVAEYVSFLDCLINTAKDVQLLRQKKIIAHLLGDDEAVTKIFNKIGDNIVVSNDYYASVINEVNEHCKKRRNRWMAKLRRDYFNSPWAIISVLAAIALLLLTLMQTVYTVMSYY